MNQTATDLFFCDFPTIVRVNLIKLLQDTDNITMATFTLVKVLLIYPRGHILKGIFMGQISASCS